MRVELQDIKKYFGDVKANDGISFILEEGHIYGLLGENGAGKSTLMKILSGYQPPTAGTILLDGQPASFDSPLDALHAGVGMLYQDPLDIPAFTVVDNYLLGKDPNMRPNYKQAAQDLLAIAERYGFEIDLDARIDELSIGERQQLELTRLLAGGAQFLILDEPTTGISGDQKDLLFDSMRKLAKEENKTLILVSHKLEEVQDLCEHVFVLRKGKQVGVSDIPCPNEKLVEMMFGEVPARSPRQDVASEKTMLQISDLTIETQRLTLNDINLRVQSGEVFGLAGLEGSGQALLLQACAGLQMPAKGQIVLDGEDITQMHYHQRIENGLAFIAAGRLEEGLVAGLSLTEHMVLYALEKSFMIDWEHATQATAERIEYFQVVGKATSTADELSGGNQQRFLLSMLNAPLKLILLEQPTRGLDVRSTNWVWEELYERRADGTAIIFISADLDEVIERSDRIAVFSGGVMSRIVQASETTAEELGHMIGGEEHESK